MSQLKPVHPGDVLREDFMKPMELTGYRLAKSIKVPAQRINDIIHGKRAVTADTDLRLARYFGISEGIFLGIQAKYELEVTRRKLGKQIAREVEVRAA
ncbi:MAG: HigA family addiction module antitoxin [Gammaproteobacteria bacterium]